MDKKLNVIVKVIRDNGAFVMKDKVTNEIKVYSNDCERILSGTFNQTYLDKLIELGILFQDNIESNLFKSFYYYNYRLHPYDFTEYLLCRYEYYTKGEYRAFKVAEKKAIEATHINRIQLTRMFIRYLEEREYDGKDR